MSPLSVIKKIIYHEVIGWVRPSRRGEATGPVDSDYGAFASIGRSVMVPALYPKTWMNGRKKLKYHSELP
jgi:hypothetical protein